MTLRVVFRRAARAEFDAAALCYEDRQAGVGAQFVSEINRVVELVSNHPSVFPPSTSKFDVRRHAAFRTQCSFARRRIVWSSWLCFTHDETRLSGRRARNSPSSVQNPTEPSVAGLACRSRAPSLAMDDAFRAGASSTTRTSVSCDDAAVLVGGMEL